MNNQQARIWAYLDEAADQFEETYDGCRYLSALDAAISRSRTFSGPVFQAGWLVMCVRSPG